MAQTQVRGLSQLLDQSVTLQKLTPSLQDLINRTWSRADFAANDGQDLLTNANFNPSFQTDVYLNGVLLNPSEYTVNTGSITLTAPLLADDHVTVFYGRLVTPYYEGAVGHIIPNQNEAYDLGSADYKFRDLYLSGNTIHLGDTKIGVNTSTQKIEFNNAADEPVAVSLAGSSINELGDVVITNPTQNQMMKFDGTNWVNSTLDLDNGITDHGMLTGLADDDHSQYALADGSRGNFAATSHSHAGVYEPADASILKDADIGVNVASQNHVGATGTAHGNATTSVAGFMSAADKTKLDGVASGANAYSLPVATATVLGGVKDGTGVTVDGSGVLSVEYGTASGTAVQGNDARVTADQDANVASIRTLGTSPNQAAAGNHSHALHNLSNVNISFNSDNEILAWDAASSQWVNQTAAELKLATTDSSGNVNITGGVVTGHIIPSTTNTYDIGTDLLRFRSIYANDMYIGTNTLYLGETPVLGTDQETIIIKADPDQSMMIKTTGLGTTTLTSEKSLTLTTNGMNADVLVQTPGVGSKVRFTSATSVELTAPSLLFAGDVATDANASVAGNLTVSGNLYVNGTNTIVNSTTVTTKDNIITLNYGETGSGVTAGKSGIQVDRGEDADYQIVFDETDDLFKVGMVSQLETIASRPWVIDNMASINHVGATGTAHGAATTSVAGFMSATDKTKLDGIAASANNYTHPTSGVSVGTYKSVTVDVNGHVTAGTNPTTLAGYGITDAQALDADLTAIAGLAGTSGLLKKTAANTWSLDTSSYLTGNQSITISGDASGSGTTSISLTLANSGVTASDYTKVTVDAKGRVTAGTNPTTLAGYGITDAASSSHVGATGTAHGNATTSVAGFMSATDKTKLDGIAASANNYTHPTSGVTANTYKSVTVDVNGHVTAGTNPTTLAGYGITDAASSSHVGATGTAHGNATTSVAGFMSATDKSKLDGIAVSANNYTHPTSGVTAGTYTKVTVDANGHATSGTTLSASDIPNLDASKITTGTIDAARLPSYVDDVIEAANLAGFPVTGETGKIYVALDTNKTYRWSGSAYVYITSGAVDSVAGKTGVVALVKGDVGLGNVDNTSDANKPVSTAQQTALNLKANLDSPTLTGTPAAPTAAVNTNTTQIATTAFVNAEIANDAAPIAHVGATGTAHGNATTSVAGFMSATDKSKLDGIAASANNYTHPTSGVSAGTYKSVTVDTNGHVTAGTNPTTLAGYGITDAAPSSHVGATGTAHGNATTSVAGFMSATDKTKLDGIAASANNYTLPVASSTAIGGVKVSATAQTVAANAVTTTASRTYATQLDASNNAVVNVPWTDTVYTHPTSGVSAGTYKSVTVDTNGHVTAGTNPTTLAGYGITDAINTSARGAANGVASLDASGLVPSTQLPSYVDDVLEYAALASFPVTGETAKIYVAQDTNKIYRWSGSAYIEISPVAGNADTATKLATARTLTIGSTGKSFDGSANVSWTLAEVGAAATNQTMYIGTTALAINRASATQSLTGITSIDGSAGTLTTGRTIGMTGDVSWTSASFNGSANVTGTATLATTGVTAGTYQSVTVDTKGRVTAGSNTLSSVTVDQGGLYSSTLTTSTTTANQVVNTFATASVRTVKHLVQATSGTAYHATEVLVVHDGTTAYMTESSTITTGASLITLDADISSGNLRLLVTPANAVTVVKVVSTVVNA